MAKNLQPGDVVQLKSGGPLMTVQRVAPTGTESSATCLWFSDAGKLENAVFSLATLAQEKEGETYDS